MKKYKKIIFVCMENTCRSIMAEAIFNSVKGDHPLEVISRGLVVLFPEPVNTKAVAILKSHQLSPAKEYSEELVQEDLTEDTLILTMTEEELRRVIEKLDCKADLATLRGFLGQEGELNEPSGALTDYGMFYEHLDLLVKTLAELLFKEEDTQ